VRGVKPSGHGKSDRHCHGQGVDYPTGLSHRLPNKGKEKA